MALDLTGIGTIIGGTADLTGGILGAVNAVHQQRQQERNRRRAQAVADEAFRQGTQDIANWRNARGSILDDDARNAYRDLVANADWDSAGNIDFNKDAYSIDDYRKANEGSIMQGVVNATKGSGAAAGSSWGSGALGNIASAAAEKQIALDDAARSAMNADRQFDYSVARDSASQRLSALQNRLNSLGQAYASDVQGIDDVYGSIMSLGQANAQNKVNALLS